MNKIAFIIPWYGEKIPGGAEMELRGIAEHLHSADIGIQVEILTTCVKDFNSDWNKDYYKPGKYTVGNLLTRRFKVRKRDATEFDRVNCKLMNQMPLSSIEEEIFIREMVNSPDLYQYIKEKQEDYDLFVYIPYMFGTTYYGIEACPDKSVLIPCFHDESYIYINIYKAVFSKLKGIIYLAQPEYDLANTIFDFTNTKQAVLGGGVDTQLAFNGDRFREKYKISEPYILYAGRKDSGKNVDTLLKYFEEFKLRNPSNIRLVLIGGGELSITARIKDAVLDLGFLDIQDKYDAYNGALVLCQPSLNESFSLVIMESWLCERPVLVHANCNVTQFFAKESNGGLYFENYFEFEGCINYYLEHNEVANKMGKNGKEFVENNFSWSVIVERYYDFLKSLVCK